MTSKPCLFSAPTYRTLKTYWDTADDAPGPRCGHTLTAVAGTRLILFGGATAVQGGGSSSAPGIRLAGVTNSVYSYDISTRKWTRLRPAGEPPSPRAAHAATAVGTMVVFQGGIGLAGQPIDDLYVLDLTNDKFKWHRVVVQGQAPGPRYGHAMDMVDQRHLVIVSGNDGKRVLSDAWALYTDKKPYAWQKLNPVGDKPTARMYATASAHSDGRILLCGGRDSSGAPLGDCYWLLMHGNGQWEWTLAPGVSPSPRYQHAAVFVGAHLLVTGGVLKGGHAVEGEAAVAVLDTAAGDWHVALSKTKNGNAEHNCYLELMRRCRHASASDGAHIYVYGGLRGDILLDDLLVAETPFQSEINSPIITSERASIESSPRMSNPNLNLQSFASTSDSSIGVPTASSISMDNDSLEKLREALAAEAEAPSAVWQAAHGASANSTEETSENNSQAAESTTDVSDTEADVHLHPGAVGVAKEAVGNLGGMVDQFENESRQMVPSNSDAAYPAKNFTGQKSQDLHENWLLQRDLELNNKEKYHQESKEMAGRLQVEQMRVEAFKEALKCLVTFLQDLQLCHVKKLNYSTLLPSIRNEEDVALLEKLNQPGITVAQISATILKVVEQQNYTQE